MSPKSSAHSNKKERSPKEDISLSAKVTTAKPTVKVTFGSVTIETTPPDEAEIKRNIKAGQDAFRRAKHVLVTPGVELNIPDDVPLFHADPNEPDKIVRVLHGKTERGKIVNGRFRKIAH